MTKKAELLIRLRNAQERQSSDGTTPSPAFFASTFPQNRIQSQIAASQVRSSQGPAEQPLQSPQSGPGPSPQQSSPQSTSVEEGPDSSSKDGRKQENTMLIHLLSQDDEDEEEPLSGSMVSKVAFFWKNGEGWNVASLELMEHEVEDTATSSDFLRDNVLLQICKNLFTNNGKTCLLILVFYFYWSVHFNYPFFLILKFTNLYSFFYRSLLTLMFFLCYFCISLLYFHWFYI